MKNQIKYITEKDAIAEGIDSTSINYRDYGLPEGVMQGVPPIYSFSTLWDSINAKRGKYSWDDNPWVWAIKFKKANRGNSHD
ncbi:hypothetical protein ACFL47_02605 [Candidatus Latescibacterota bacterium]